MYTCNFCHKFEILVCCTCTCTCMQWKGYSFIYFCLILKLDPFSLLCISLFSSCSFNISIFSILLPHTKEQQQNCCCQVSLQNPLLLLLAFSENKTPKHGSLSHLHCMQQYMFIYMLHVEMNKGQKNRDRGDNCCIFLMMKRIDVLERARSRTVCVNKGRLRMTMTCKRAPLHFQYFYSILVYMCGMGMGWWATRWRK